MEALARRGDEVIGVDNFDPFYPRQMKERNLAEAGPLPRFSFREQDMLDADALAALLTPDTVVVHLAAKAGVRPSLADPVGYARANVTGTAAVVEAARRAGVSRFVFGSSSSVYGDSTPVPFREDATAVEPVSPYAATKRAAELFLHSVAPIYGLRVASLRFFTVYGPRQRPDLAIHAFTRRMVEGRDGDAVRRRHPVAGLHVLRRHRGGRRGRGGLDRGRAGRSGHIQSRRQPHRADRRHGGGDRPGARDSSPRIEWAPMQPGDVQRTAADLTKSDAVLGYMPHTPFPEGIRRFVAWFREAYGRAD